MSGADAGTRRVSPNPQLTDGDFDPLISRVISTPANRTFA